MERSLRALATDRLDLYPQQIGDRRVSVQETFGTLGELFAEGKVRDLGIRKARRRRCGTRTESPLLWWSRPNTLSPYAMWSTTECSPPPGSWA
ncbi:aldo/keto reductase [Micromonospora sp. NPDC005367]|uniref:aldo/keto reductase n=1 Tax=Micromonospora sp. NPDC005367 TaxID=3155590 RepID=UPI0033B2C5F3